MASVNTPPKGNNHSIHFITSNKGQPLLVMNNYVYKCNKKTNKKKYWICTATGCNIFVHTDINNVYIGGGKIYHEHAASPELIEVKQTRQRIKDRVLNEVTSIGNIYDEEMMKTCMSSTAVAIFPTIHEICKYLYYTSAEAKFLLL